MKLVYAIVLLGMVSCNSADKKEQEALHMPGAYSMLSQTLNDGKKDTTYTTLKQLKIYTDDYMMYANTNPADSSSAFGIGTYRLDSGKVVETVIYNASDSSASANPSDYTLAIEKMPKGYKQVIANMGTGPQKWTLTEVYDSVGTATTSPLDGAWKQTKSYNTSGKDTIVDAPIQYKIYCAGHFIWGHTYKDSANKIFTGIGFGTFTMDGANKLKETVTASTYYQVRGNTVDIGVEMNGADEYTQTITQANGNKSIEVYQRLKK